MTSCIRIPRILLPESGFEKWSVIACDRFASDREYWNRVERQVGDAPSTLNMILPEVFLGEDDETRIPEIHNNMYAALEKEQLTKLNRGCVLVERTTQSGVRRGLVAAIDLEAYTSGKGEVSPIRASEEVVPARLSAHVSLRRGAPIEFPHAMLFYRDKRNKILRKLLADDPEVLYDFDLMEDGGRLKGYFIPAYSAEEAVKSMYGKDDISFAVADGNDCVAAAKAYWEEVKKDLSKEEQISHPARCMLVELVNLYDDAVEFLPVHRLLKEVDAEAFCDWFKKSVKCRRVGNVLYPALPAGAPAVEKTDALAEEFVRVNGGRIEYICGEEKLAALAKEEDCVGIALKPLEKDGFFERLKGGVFPKKTFSVCEDTEKRYYTEAREISYD